MGTCYSKSGHELDTSNPDKRPKERKKGSQKNGHIDSNHKPKLIIEDFDIIQKDVSDTVYTEDSHTNGLDVDNLLHKSQQTSLDMLAKDTNRNTETVTVDDSNETSDMKDACSSKEVILDCEYESQVTEHNKEKLEDKVVGSDSGVVLENTVEPETRTEVSCKNLVKPPTTLSSEKTVEQDSESKVESTSAETQPHSDKVQNSFSDINSGVNNSKPQAKSVTEHSSYTCYHDLDKLKLAVRQSNSSMPADQWSLSDSLDTSYDLSSVHSQPIRTMNMNGRDVVVIDQELFSQIIDEIQFLKMKLSQLTEVIQETDAPENNVTEGTSFLSSSA